MKIGADLPLSGDDAPDGLPVKDAIRLAIKQAGTICGADSHRGACVRLQLSAYDDVSKGIHDPAKGATNVQLMAADEQIVGVIGPLYESLARSELPVANHARLAIISPATVDECLTQEPADGHCHGRAASLRPSGGNTFFRVVTTRLAEGPAAADFAFKTLHKRHAFLVEDQSGAVHALAVAFALRFREDGGTLAGSPETADVVYAPGSDVGSVAATRRQVGSAMPNLPLLGSDALANDQYARAAGALARGTYYAVAGADPAKTKAAAAFNATYRKTYGGDPGRVGLQAFDATNLLLQAIAKAIDDAGGNRPARQQVLTQVANTTAYSGLMGTMGFDKAGDTTLKLVIIYQWDAPTASSGDFMAQVDVH